MLPSSDFFNVSYTARCVACHGVRSHPVPVALVGASHRDVPDA
jgi:mono/diheme cytochrome c family protein